MDKAKALAIAFLVFTEPEYDRNLRAVVELAGKSDDSVNEVGVDEAHNRLLFMFD